MEHRRYLGIEERVFHVEERVTQRRYGQIGGVHRRQHYHRVSVRGAASTVYVAGAALLDHLRHAFGEHAERRAAGQTHAGAAKAQLHAEAQRGARGQKAAGQHRVRAYAAAHCVHA